MWIRLLAKNTATAPSTIGSHSWAVVTMENLRKGVSAAHYPSMRTFGDVPQQPDGKRQVVEQDQRQQAEGQRTQRRQRHGGHAARLSHERRHLPVAVRHAPEQQRNQREPDKGMRHVELLALLFDETRVLQREP